MLRRIEGGSRSRAGAATGSGFSGNGAPKLATGRDALGKPAEVFGGNAPCGGGAIDARLESESFRLELMVDGSGEEPVSGWDAPGIACSSGLGTAGRLLGTDGNDAAMGARSGNPMTDGNEALGSVVGGAARSCPELGSALLSERLSISLGTFDSIVPRGVGMLGGSTGAAVRAAWLSNAGACSVDAARGLRNFDAPKGVGSDNGRGLLLVADGVAGPDEGVVLGKFRRLLPGSWGLGA